MNKTVDRGASPNNEEIFGNKNINNTVKGNRSWTKLCREELHQKQKKTKNIGRHKNEQHSKEKQANEQNCGEGSFT